MSDIDRRIALLRGLSCFSDVPDNELHRAALALTRSMTPSSHVFNEGELSSAALIVIAAGYARVERDGQVIGFLGPGRSIRRPGATVTAVTPMTLYALDDADIERLYGCDQQEEET